ncbi:unnamed protein product [Caenorhabditis auriculariae]|uniref:Uncharacterized protein n=1 Tax=Caenorhabditis auriculariae TaxID=2777116 RepID=A0A8S1GSS5_9PELO|nr:unnamed protein product [Caenorhabditis auriculariae]
MRVTRSNQSHHSLSPKFSAHRRLCPARGDELAALIFVGPGPGKAMTSTGSTVAIGVAESEDSDIQNARRVFLAGLIPKRTPRSLNTIANDLYSEFYVSCNSGGWEDGKTRTMLSGADIVLFFVNEFTLRDTNCLLTLQYAWQLMLPIIMMRPPRTKLVICNRGVAREDIVIAHGALSRNPNSHWELLDDASLDVIDYGLLQDLLYEGYKISIVYDRLEHTRCIKRIKQRLISVITNTSLPGGSRVDSSNSLTQPVFYLSPTNDSTTSLSRRAMKAIREAEKASSEKRLELSHPKLSLSQSAGSLSTVRSPTTPQRLKQGRKNDRKRIKSPPPYRTAATSSEEEGQIDQEDKEEDGDDYVDEIDAEVDVEDEAQDESKLSGRPLQLPQHTVHHISVEKLVEKAVFGSVWGSDTSLEEEVKVKNSRLKVSTFEKSQLAGMINAGDAIDDIDSPIGSPAPYVGEL